MNPSSKLGLHLEYLTILVLLVNGLVKFIFEETAGHYWACRHQAHPSLVMDPGSQRFRPKLVETHASSLDCNKVPRILNGTGPRTHSMLEEKYQQVAPPPLSHLRSVQSAT